MRRSCILLAFVLTSCGPRQPEVSNRNRFLETLKPVVEIADLARITGDDRSIHPIFAPGDTMIFFSRLLVSSPEDTSGRSPEELIKPYGINIRSKDLFTLSDNYDYPQRIAAEADRLPGHRASNGRGSRTSETTVWAAWSPDSQTVAYETVLGHNKDSHTIYLSRGDSTVQLTFGNLPCFIDRFSNTGRYLSVLCGRGPTRIVVFDLDRNTGYEVESDGDFIDCQTLFSPDDKMMLFIRSDKKYSVEYDFFGDIWLLNFRG